MRKLLKHENDASQSICTHKHHTHTHTQLILHLWNVKHETRALDAHAIEIWMMFYYNPIIIVLWQCMKCLLNIQNNDMCNCIGETIFGIWSMCVREWNWWRSDFRKYFDDFDCENGTCECVFVCCIAVAISKCSHSMPAMWFAVLILGEKPMPKCFLSTKRIFVCVCVCVCVPCGAINSV